MYFFLFSPERRDLKLWLLLSNLYGMTGKTRPQVIQGEKGVVEVQCGDLIGHLGVVGAAWVPVAKNNVVKPVGDDAFCVHQVSDGLQHSLRTESD